MIWSEEVVWRGGVWFWVGRSAIWGGWSGWVPVGEVAMELELSATVCQGV